MILGFKDAVTGQSAGFVEGLKSVDGNSWQIKLVLDDNVLATRSMGYGIRLMR